MLRIHTALLLGACLMFSMRGQCGEIHGRTLNVFTNQVLPGATVKVKNTRDYEESQETTNQGSYRFGEVPAGELTVYGQLERFRFPEEKVPLKQRESRVVNLYAMPATHGPPDPEFAEWFRAEAERFDDFTTGCQAAWSRLTWFGVPPIQKYELARRVAEYKPESMNVPVIRGYSQAKPEMIFAVLDEFEDYARGKQADFPTQNKGRIDRAVAVDLSRSALANSEGDGAAEKFYQAWGGSWGDEYAREAARQSAALDAIRSLRFSQWQTQRDNDKLLVRFQGESGEFVAPRSSAPGRLTELHYFLDGKELKIAGLWRSPDIRGWFSFNLNADGFRQFSGAWGTETVIGRKPLGRWVGTRIPDGD